MVLSSHLPSSDPLAKRMASTKLAFRESNPRTTPLSHKQKPPEQTFSKGCQADSHIQLGTIGRRVTCQDGGEKEADSPLSPLSASGSARVLRERYYYALLSAFRWSGWPHLNDRPGIEPGEQPTGQKRNAWHLLRIVRRIATYNSHKPYSIVSKIISTFFGKCK